MQKAQDLFGFLSLETQSLIADSLGIPVSEVYGVATFYAQFSLEPKGENIISICTGTACYVKGAQAVVDEAERNWEFPAAKPARTVNLPFRERDVSDVADLLRSWL